MVRVVFSSKDENFNESFIDAETINSDIKKNSIQGIMNIHIFSFSL